MSTLLQCYKRLLTDISSLSEVHLCAPDGLDVHWITIGGPALDKELLQYLEHEDILITPNYCLVFPSWLKPLWDRYLHKKDAVFIKYLRQVLVFGYKAEFQPSDQQIKAAQAVFENTDRQVGEFEASLSFNSPFWRSARRIVSRMTGDIDFYKITPFHGPGSVFPSCVPSERSNFDTIHDAIERFYPYWEFFNGMRNFVPNASEILNAKIKTSDAPIRGKLVYVPKDSRGPRSICVHPKESIWIQQGQRAVLEPVVVRRSNRQINFDDQTINGQLAMSSSISREYSTLDLKDASDRLGCKVVSFLFGAHYPMLSCTRMGEVILPCGRVIALSKWAPMGNALCFPVESICFWALARAGIEAKFGSNASQRVYVFGDDIIVPSTYVGAAVDGLERAGLAVNKLKSFTVGFFRESCGIDAFKGINVTPVRMKKHRIDTMSDLVSLCALAKNLRVQGYESAASFLYHQCRRFMDKRGKFLTYTNNPETQGIVEYIDRGFVFFLANIPESHLRWNKAIHRFETKSYLAVASTTTETDGWYHLQDSLLSLERRDAPACPSGNTKARSGRTYPIPYRMQLKQGWTPLLLNK